MERLWTRNFILLTVAMLLLFIGFYLLIPTLPLFIRELGGTESQVGLVIGIFTLSAVLFRPITGTLIDRYGRRPFLIAGLIFFAIMTYLYHRMAGIGALLLLRIFYGASWAVSTTSAGTAIADIIPASRRGEGMGWYGLAMTIGMAIGPMTGLLIVKHQSFSALFTIATAVVIAALVLVLVTRIPFRKQHEAKVVLLEKSALPTAMVIFFLTVTYGGITSFLPLFADQIGVDAGLFFLVYAITLTVIRPLSGRLSDIKGESFIIIPSIVLAVLGLLILSAAHGVWGIILTAVIYGLGFGSAHPILQAATIRMAPPHRRGIASATFFMLFDLGIGLGTIALGWITQMTSYRVMYLICAGSALIGLLIFLTYVKRLLVINSINAADGR